MIIKDIIEGYFVLRKLKKLGYVEDDGLGMKEFINLVIEAENNINVKKDVSEQEKDV